MFIEKVAPLGETPANKVNKNVCKCIMCFISFFRHRYGSTNNPNMGAYARSSKRDSQANNQR